jgi:hypothetical protein
MFHDIVILLLVVYVIITATLLNIIMRSEFTLCLVFVSLPDMLFSPVALRPNAGHGVLIGEVSRPHTMTHHTP